MYSTRMADKELGQDVERLLELAGNGSVACRVEHVYPLPEAADAHRAIAARATTGKVLLVP